MKDFIQNILFTNNLPFSLKKIHPKILVLFSKSPTDIYYQIKKYHFTKIIPDERTLTPQILKKICHMEIDRFFVDKDSYQVITKHLKEKLLNETRSISIGNINSNLKKQLLLLIINQEHLYQDPANDPLLRAQFKSNESLAKILIENPLLIKNLYRSVSKSGHNYLIVQPFLSSLLLLAFLLYIRLFSTKEIESLFQVSTFKDIGLSLLPKTSEDQNIKLKKEREIILNHPKYSHMILKDRLPLDLGYLNIISSHHQLADSNRKSKYIQGPESLFVQLIDILVAMISKRPYQNSHSLTFTLKYIGELIGFEYNFEYRLLVNFIQKFFN